MEWSWDSKVGRIVLTYLLNGHEERENHFIGY